MENKKINEVKELLKKDLVETEDLKVLDDLRVKYLGKKGNLTLILKGMGKLTKEEREKNQLFRYNFSKVRIR